MSEFPSDGTGAGNQRQQPPISSLPVELIFMIFKQCIDVDERQYHEFSTVTRLNMTCRDLRNVYEANWNTIFERALKALELLKEDGTKGPWFLTAKFLAMAYDKSTRHIIAFEGRPPAEHNLPVGDFAVEALEYINRQVIREEETPHLLGKTIRQHCRAIFLTEPEKWHAPLPLGGVYAYAVNDIRLKRVKRLINYTMVRDACFPYEESLVNKRETSEK